MTHPICNACETVAHCSRHGCIPAQAAPIDWFRVLMDLKRQGMSLRQVAASVGVTKSAVIGWKNLYAEPKHGDGERLLQVWMHATRMSREAVPLEIEPQMVGNPTTAGRDTLPA